MDQTVGAGRYRLIECLGRGRRSEVWRGLDTRADAFRAVKLLRGDPATWASRQLAIAEAGGRMERLRHPNIVSVRDMGIEGDLVFLVMDLVPGGTLEGRLQRDGALPPRMAVRLLRGVLAALAFAHDERVLHHRLTTRKILLEADGTPKVTDFGVAEVEGSGPPAADPKADVYAAGGVLFALLTGHEPGDPVLDVRGIPDALATVIRRARAVPETRYATVAALFEGVEATIRNLPADPPAAPLVRPEQLVRAEAHLSEPPARAVTLPSRGAGPMSPLAPPPPAPPPAPPSPLPGSEAETPHIASVPTVIREAAPSPSVPAARRLPTVGDYRWLWLPALLLVGVVGIGGGAVAQYVWQGPLDWNDDAPPGVVPETPPAAVVEPSPPPSLPKHPGKPRPAPAIETLPPPPEPGAEPIVVVVPEAPAEPPPPPEPPVVWEHADESPYGKWTIAEAPTPEGTASDRVTLQLVAEGDVKAYSGRTARPRIVLQCDLGEPRAWVEPGLPAESIDAGAEGAEMAAAVLAFDDDTSGRRVHLKKIEDRLYFVGARKWTEELDRHERLTFTFTPFASAPSTTTFDLRGLDAALKRLRASCPQ